MNPKGQAKSRLGPNSCDHVMGHQEHEHGYGDGCSGGDLIAWSECGRQDDYFIRFRRRDLVKDRDITRFRFCPKCGEHLEPWWLGLVEAVAAEDAAEEALEAARVAEKERVANLMRWPA